MPLGFLYRDLEFWLVTSPQSEHGRVMLRTGRATPTVHHEHYEAGLAVERYVAAEGPVRWTDDDCAAVTRAQLAKDRGESDADGWLVRFGPGLETQQAAVLTPERLSGYIFEDRL